MFAMIPSVIYSARQGFNWRAAVLVPLRSRLQGYWIEAGSIHHGDNTHVITSTCEVEDLVIIINNYLWVLHFCNMQTHCLGVMVHNHFSTLWRACYNLWTLSCFVLDMDATLFALWFYFYVLFDFLWDIWLHWLYLLLVGLIHYWHMIQFESLPWYCILFISVEN